MSRQSLKNDLLRRVQSELERQFRLSRKNRRVINMLFSVRDGLEILGASMPRSPRVKASALQNKGNDHG
jgi:hypothetical protein